jgi:YVTN family beta-propeller protein
VYVSDETGSAIVVIDAQSGDILQRIAVGKRPRGIRLSLDGTRLLVALSGSPIGGPGVDESRLPPADRAADGIGVVDVSSGTVVRKYQSGPDPESFDLSRDGALLFVSNEDAAEMSVLDLESGTIIARVKVGDEPEGVTVRPDGRVVYVTCEGTNEVVGVDTSTFKAVARIESGPRPRSVGFDRTGAVGFIMSENERLHRVRSGDASGHRDDPDPADTRNADAAAADGAVALARRTADVRIARPGKIRGDCRRGKAGARAHDRRRRRAPVGHRHQPGWPQAVHRERSVRRRVRRGC